jgi:hypothetical protein
MNLENSLASAQWALSQEMPLPRHRFWGELHHHIRSKPVPLAPLTDQEMECFNHRFRVLESTVLGYKAFVVKVIRLSHAKAQ